jgi:hypothetical protein
VRRDEAVADSNLGIFIREQRGKWAYYRLVPDTSADMASMIIPDGD